MSKHIRDHVTKLTNEANAEVKGINSIGFFRKLTTGGRRPDRIIYGQSDGSPYLLRWHLIPRNPYFNIYLHCFIGDDIGPELHDHPWWSIGTLIKGELNEVTFVNKPVHWIGTEECHAYITPLTRWIPKYRSAEFKHRLLLNPITLRPQDRPLTSILWRDFETDAIPECHAWTIFITGPKKRTWGFWDKAGNFTNWRDFLRARGWTL